MEEDDLDGDMDFIHDIQSEIVHDIIFVYPNTLTAPLTFSLWEHEVPFYEALQKLYKARNTKRFAKLGDIFSLSVGVRRGWVRLIPLHLMNGKKYLDKILALSPTGLWMLLDTNSEETKWGVGHVLASKPSLMARLHISSRAIRLAKSHILSPYGTHTAIWCAVWKARFGRKLSKSLSSP